MGIRWRAIEQDTLCPFLCVHMNACTYLHTLFHTVYAPEVCMSVWIAVGAQMCKVGSEERLKACQLEWPSETEEQVLCTRAYV